MESLCSVGGLPFRKGDPVFETIANVSADLFSRGRNFEISQCSGRWLKEVSSLSPETVFILLSAVQIPYSASPELQASHELRGGGGSSLGRTKVVESK